MVGLADIWYNNELGFHVLVTEKEPYPSEWWIVYVFELGDYNWYMQDDFTSIYGWEKVA